MFKLFRYFTENQGQIYIFENTVCTPFHVHFTTKHKTFIGLHNLVQTDCDENTRHTHSSHSHTILYSWTEKDSNNRSTKSFIFPSSPGGFRDNTESSILLPAKDSSFTFTTVCVSRCERTSVSVNFIYESTVKIREQDKLQQSNVAANLKIAAK